MKVVIASDHGGFELKEKLKVIFSKRGIILEDLGTHSTDSVDYPDYAEALALAIKNKRADHGVLLCGSGVGASVAVNKMPWIRAGLCHDTYSAHQGVEHDNMNVLVLGAWVVGIKLAEELVNAFLQAKFCGEERQIRRLEKINQITQRYNKNETEKEVSS